MDQRKTYVSPFSQRYASKEMQYLFSQEKKYSTWRKLWVALAQSEMELGLKQNGKAVITEEMIAEMQEHIFDINYEAASEYETVFRHDVMAHIHAFGDSCPKAAGIIHLGATSCYVGDNTDIIVMKEALALVKKKLINLINVLSKFCKKYSALPTLSYTHLQPAQPTTVGKRATLWVQDFLSDAEDVNYVSSSLKLLGCKGTTGTQASFAELFESKDAPLKLDKLIAEKMGFSDTYSVSGQTYSRKVDCRVLGVLSSIACSATKLSNDIRFLQHLKEVEEPFESGQVGSSAMPYKRNPMRSERIASLARYVLTDSMNPYLTASSQWLERTLDDSANRRISIAEGFLAIDGVLDLCLNVCDGLVVNEKVIESNLKKELPFMITENILMDKVKEGGDRQKLHEEIRKLSVEAGNRVKREGLENDLFERLCSSKELNISKEQKEEYFIAEKYVGRAKEQVEEFLNTYVKPVLEANKDLLGFKTEINI